MADRPSPCQWIVLTGQDRPSPYHAPCGCYYERLGPDPGMGEQERAAAEAGMWSHVKACPETAVWYEHVWAEAEERRRTHPSKPMTGAEIEAEMRRRHPDLFG